MWLSYPKKFLREMYDWTLAWSKSKYAPFALFFVAFAESSFFLIPPDVLLIAMIIASPSKWIKYGAITLTGSVLGGIFGYFIGYGLYEAVGVKIVEFYSLQGLIESIKIKYEANAFLTIFIAAFTPIPYKLITISAGLFKIPIYTLIIASVIGRGMRFFLVSGLLRMFGEKIAKAIDKYFDILSLIFGALLIGGFLVVKFLF